jgi:hypothetical protein
MLAMIAYHTGDVHHTGTISGYQREENLGLQFALQSRIPDSQSFLLESD